MLFRSDTNENIYVVCTKHKLMYVETPSCRRHSLLISCTSTCMELTNDCIWKRLEVVTARWIRDAVLDRLLNGCESFYVCRADTAPCTANIELICPLQSGTTKIISNRLGHTSWTLLFLRVNTLLRKLLAHFCVDLIWRFAGIHLDDLALFLKVLHDRHALLFKSSKSLDNALLIII